MLRRVNFYSICFAFGLSVLLILAGSRYTDNTYSRSYPESSGTISNFLRVYASEDTLPQPLPSSTYDWSQDVDKILNRTRGQIKSGLAGYNFSQSGARGLQDLLMESGGRPVRSVIASTWRSGTTFLGEILNALPMNFYHYEPLLKYGIIRIRGPPYADQAINTIKGMLHCDFSGMEEYFKYGSSHLHQFWHNTRLWDHCSYMKEMCFDPDFTSKFCRLFPFQSMKIVRLRLSLFEELLKDSHLNVKVVLLIRDPRGVMQSRQQRSFCPPSPDCWHPDLLCADMISDYVAAGRLLHQFPNRLMVLRYEELALNPNGTTLQLFKFLGLSIMPQVSNFLHSHTNVKEGGVSSTFRVSRDVPFQWKNILKFDYVDEIQTVCKEAMDLWGYRKAHNVTHMRSKEFNPLDKYTIRIAQ